MAHAQPGELRDVGDGTVEDADNETIWLKYAGGFFGSWSAAKQWAQSLGDGRFGLNDGSQPGNWRLPTQAEWEQIINPSATGPAIRNTGSATGSWQENDPFLVVRRAVGTETVRYWTSEPEEPEEPGTPITHYMAVNIDTGDIIRDVSRKERMWAMAVRNFDHTAP